MKPGKKSTAAKTMRVATTFTGVAACAAAFAPAATAVTHPTDATGATIPYRPVPVVKHLHRAGTTPAFPISGSIRSASCTTARKNWLHVQWYSISGAGPFLTCFGFKGAFSTFIAMAKQCGGNNHGDFWPGPLTYGPGTTYRNFNPRRFVSVITDSGWAGTNAC
jgi:hypothetical protein